MKRLWIAFTLVMTFSFLILGWIGTRIYQEIPPVSDIGSPAAASSCRHPSCKAFVGCAFRVTPCSSWEPSHWCGSWLV